jgi:hypothetical protein
MPLGEEGGFGKLLETSCKEIGVLRCNFSLLFSLLTRFALIFFAFGIFRLHANKAKKNHFFRFKARTKIPTFSLIFALSEYERRTLIRT